VIPDDVVVVVVDEVRGTRITICVGVVVHTRRWTCYNVSVVVCVGPAAPYGQHLKVFVHGQRVEVPVELVHGYQGVVDAVVEVAGWDNHHYSLYRSRSYFDAFGDFLHEKGLGLQIEVETPFVCVASYVLKVEVDVGFEFTIGVVVVTHGGLRD